MIHNECFSRKTLVWARELFRKTVTSSALCKRERPFETFDFLQPFVKKAACIPASGDVFEPGREKGKPSLAGLPLFPKQSPGLFGKFTLFGAHCVSVRSRKKVRILKASGVRAPFEKGAPKLSLTVFWNGLCTHARVLCFGFERRAKTRILRQCQTAQKTKSPCFPLRRAAQSKGK